MSTYRVLYPPQLRRGGGVARRNVEDVVAFSNCPGTLRKAIDGLAQFGERRIVDRVLDHEVSVFLVEIGLLWA